ncbi:hypothetical protein OSTOST_06432, partial [Ostertagia ostertagi]
MKKEWIMSDEARLEKKQRVEENHYMRLFDHIQSLYEQELYEDLVFLHEMIPKLGQVERGGGAFGGKYTQSAPAGAWAALAARVLNRPVKVTYMSTGLSDTCYSIPVMRAEGYALKTNKSNNTFVRGCGLPQAYFAMNGILCHVAHAVNKPLEKIMKMKFNKNGGIRPSKEPILNDALLECWEECLKWSDFDELREEVDRFN